MIAFAGALAWIAFGVVLFKLNPNESLAFALLFFYVTLFVALACTFTVVGFYFRVWFFKNEIFYKHINIALRQGVFLSLIAIFALVFQMLRVLFWWSGILVVLIFVLLEFYFSSKESAESM